MTNLVSFTPTADNYLESIFHDKYIITGAILIAIIAIAIVLYMTLAKVSQRYLQSVFHDRIRKIAKDTVEVQWHSQGRATLTKKGELRVDFTKAVNNQIQLYLSQGINSNDAFQFIQTTYPKTHRIHVTKYLVNYINANAMQKQQFKLQQEMAYRSNLNSQMAGGLTPEQFFAYKQQVNGDAVGVYIIYNATKDLYYVGQAKRLCFRVNQHFTGHGNGDVYADYKYGDSFFIKIITLRDSGYDDLDKLERDKIQEYHAYERGYNKTSGNAP